MFGNIFKDQKILITGHAGFKGSWLCSLLKNLGARIYGYSLLPYSTPRMYDITKISQILEDELIADILDNHSLISFVKKIKPILVIHLAAQPLVIESYLNPIGTYKTNVIGTLNVFEACRAVNSIKALSINIEDIDDELIDSLLNNDTAFLINIIMTQSTQVKPRVLFGNSIDKMYPLL